jgi:hypothetical protein
MFEQLMKKGKNIKEIEGGVKLWNALKKMDGNKKMPEDCYSKWEY